jgi:hypothetical protein
VITDPISQFSTLNAWKPTDELRVSLEMSTHAHAAMLSLTAVIKLLRLCVYVLIPGRTLRFRAALPENVVREVSKQPRPNCRSYCIGHDRFPDLRFQ